MSVLCLFNNTQLVLLNLGKIDSKSSDVNEKLRKRTLYNCFCSFDSNPFTNGAIPCMHVGCHLHVDLAPKLPLSKALIHYIPSDIN